MNQHLVIIALIRARSGYEQQLAAAQKTLVQEARKAAGCMRYELNIANDGSGRIAFTEQWESTMHWHKHMESSYMKTFRETAGHLIGDFDLLQMRQVA